MNFEEDFESRRARRRERRLANEAENVASSTGSEENTIFDSDFLSSEDVNTGAYDFDDDDIADSVSAPAPVTKSEFLQVSAQNALKQRHNYTIDDLLKRLVTDGGSDLHLSNKSQPRYRVDGSLKPMSDTSPVTDEWLDKQFKKIAPARLYEEFEMLHEADFSHSIDGYGRFRVNMFKQRGTLGAVFRTIPSRIKSLEELGSPYVLKELVKQPKGLILVTGPTGSGKSTTLAAMINEINETRDEHIMTIEDPIEFVHDNKKSLINQREIGTDTINFNEALKRVLRQDPDVILIGELRDAETIGIALTAAETGHLVFGTLHTQSAAKSIDRIVDSFPPAQQSQVRNQLSETLQAIVSQALIKRIGGGRVAATEILVKTPAISNLIREDNLSQIYSFMQSGKDHGMHTMDQEFQRLVADGLIEKDEVIDMLKDKTALNGVEARVSDWDYDN